MYQEIENILFWVGFHLDTYLPYTNFSIWMIFNTIVIREIVDQIKNLVEYKNRGLYQIDYNK